MEKTVALIIVLSTYIALAFVPWLARAFFSSVPWSDTSIYAAMLVTQVVVLIAILVALRPSV